MAEREYVINPSLFISESEKWFYIMVDNKIYKLNMTEEERRNLHEVIRLIHGRTWGNQENPAELKKSFRILEALGAIKECQTDQIFPRTIRIQSVEFVDNIALLNELCETEKLHFDKSRKGWHAYLSENEVILSSEKIEGTFCKPCEKQIQLMIQAIQKNEQEILNAMVKTDYIAIPLFDYAKGVRILKKSVDEVGDVENYIWFQPWHTKISVDVNETYPSVSVKCILDHMDFEAIGIDTDHALYQIYEEYKSIRKTDYE